MVQVLLQVNLQYADTMYPNVQFVMQELDQLSKLRSLLANGGGKISVTENNQILSHAYPRVDVENTWNGLPGL